MSKFQFNPFPNPERWLLQFSFFTDEKNWLGEVMLNFSSYTR